MEFVSIADDVTLAEGVRIFRFVNLYGCSIGANSRIGTFVEIQKGAVIGERCKISSHTFICEGVKMGDGCFIGHGVMFTNDKRPRAVTPDGTPEGEQDWADRFQETHVGNQVSIGSGAVILCGITIGDNACIGAGAVVTRNVGAGETVAGVPARVMMRSGGDAAPLHPTLHDPTCDPTSDPTSDPTCVSRGSARTEPVGGA